MIIRSIKSYFNEFGTQLRLNNYDNSDKKYLFAKFTRPWFNMRSGEYARSYWMFPITICYNVVGDEDENK